MKIAELARASGVNRSTIHHYLNLGLLPKPRALGPKKHLFDESHLASLRTIQKLRGEGWPLARIRERLARTEDAGDAPPPEAGPDDVRLRIIEHATRVFAERGYEGVRLSEVARQLGIGKATIYRHFESKQALFVDCVERVRFTLIPKEARERTDEVGSFEERAVRRSRAVLAHFESYRTMTHLLGSLAHGGDPVLRRKARQQLHAMVTDVEPLIRRAIAAGRVRPMDPELLAHMLWGALLGAGECLSLGEGYTEERVLEGYLDFILRGLSKPEASSG